MILQHSLQLLRYYRRMVIAIAVATTLAAAAISVVRLLVAPVYTASAKVAVMPTEAEYAFGRESGSGPRATARGLTSTYMEYLGSRPVVEAALEHVSGPGDAPAPPRSAWVEILTRGVRLARRVYRTLDSGTYVAASQHEKDVQRLMKAIKVEKVVDSYILRIEVNLNDPQLAARAANALAEAYVERVSDQLATSVGEIGGFLKQQIAEREDELSAMQAKEERVKEALGISSLAEERQQMLAERNFARQKLLDAQAESESAAADVRALETVDIAQSGRSIAALNQERSAASARLEAAKRNLQLRRSTLEHVDRSLASLRDKEEPLLEVGRQTELARIQLAELQSRLLSTYLTGSGATAQVRVIDPAIAPAYPSSPRVLRNTAAGLLAGLVAALFAVFLIDTVSGTIKTTADLERLVGGRRLGALSADLVSRATSPDARTRKRAQPRLEALGGELERGLTVLRAFDAPMIQVTGFLPTAPLCDAALAIGVALASQDHRVSCALPSRIMSGGSPRTLEGGDGRVELVEDAGDRAGAADSDAPAWPSPARDQRIRIKCLLPVAADLHLAEAARRSPVLVCVIPAGGVLERDLGEFLERASGAGLSGLCFVLLHP